jgi:hypothetical protein
MTNVNEATRSAESIQLVTTDLGNGDVMYVIGVAPRDEFNAYRTVFNRVVSSIRLTN